MPKISPLRGLDFDDVLLVPQYSPLLSRSEVDLETSLSFLPKDNSIIKLKSPIVSANMSTITGFHMVEAMHKIGCGAILHRYLKPIQLDYILESLLTKNIPPIISIGVNDPDLNSFVGKCIDHGSKAVCLDIAHGHSSKGLETVRKLRHEFPMLHIIAGNIATANAAVDFIVAGATALKVGIGNGSHCLTRTQTGAGVYQLTAIMEVSNIARKHMIPVIADGGMYSSGDIVKALAAGASTIMTGGLLAGTIESAGVDKYAGMASQEAQMNWKGFASHVEGKSSRVESKGHVLNVIRQLEEGIKSGFSYCGARNLLELWNKAEFIIKG